MHEKLAAALRRVGARVMKCRREGNTHGKWDGTQYKANADIIAHASMRDELQKIADLSIVSEEDVDSQIRERPNQYWLIDPIDGTASFAHGFSGFVCQAALMCDDLPQMAGVYAPVLDKLYMAIRGGGATLNGLPVRARMVVRERLIIVDNYPQPRGVAERLIRDLSCAEYLESGSIGLKICLVAEGQADVFVKDVQVRDWDVAAPHLVLHEAGGVLTQFNNKPFDYRGGYERHGLIAVSSMGLLDQINEIIAGYGVKL
jgi:3'(2'), 5'-bisphosphate nucleotidase